MRKSLTIVLLLGCMTVMGQSTVKENVFKDITTKPSVRNTRFACPSPAGSLRKTGKPVAFYIGDSTMRTNSNGQGWNGQWGFGLFAQEWFDANELVVENHAWGGTTSETYYKEKWAAVKSGIKAGDFVVIDFGHNDKSADVFETYMNKYIDEVRTLGATPILCSRTPRCSNGKPSGDNTYRPRGKAVAQSKGVTYIDLEAQAVPMYNAFGTWKTTQFYQDGKLHTTLLGAWHNAYCHALAIAADEANPLRQYLVDMTTPTLDIERQAGKPYTFTVGGSDTSARGTFRSGRWGLVYNSLEKGDSVMLAFGANDLKTTVGGSELGCLQTAEETQEVQTMTNSQRYELVYSYGWYIHYFLNDIKEKGAIAVLVNEERTTPEKVAEWNRQLAKKHQVKVLEKSTATKIKAVGTETDSHAIYNLSGQKVDANYKGVVIQNGRKRLVTR